MSNWKMPGKAPPTFLGEYWIDAGGGLGCKFLRYSIEDRPDAGYSVYGFVSPGGLGALSFAPRVEYIGQATWLRDRLSNHERMAEAKRRGATELWVHTPQLGDVPYWDVEARLIRKYAPPMNKQQPLGLFGLLGTVHAEPRKTALESLGSLYSVYATPRY